MTVDARTMELMNLAVDGELDAAGSEELRVAIESDAEARAAWSELQHVTNLLDSSPSVEPPAELQAQVMSAVARSRVVPFTTSRPKRRLLPLQIAAAAAAGILLVFLFAPAVFDKSSPDELRGTMSDVTPARAISASLAPSSGSAHAAIEVQVLTTGVEALQVEYDPRALELQSVVGGHGTVRNLASGGVIISAPQAPSLRLIFKRMTGAGTTVRLRAGSPDQELAVELSPVTN